MANTQSAMKAVRNSERKRVQNRLLRSRARTYIRQARALIEAGQIEEAQQAVHLATSVLDRAAQKGIIHQNNAARRKSRLVRMYNEALSQQ